MPYEEDKLMMMMIMTITSTTITAPRASLNCLQDNSNKILNLDPIIFLIITIHHADHRYSDHQ